MKKKDCLLKGQDAIEEVRRMLYGNEEGLKILDQLVEGGRLSRKMIRYANYYLSWESCYFLCQ